MPKLFKSISVALIFILFSIQYVPLTQLLKVQLSQVYAEELSDTQAPLVPANLTAASITGTSVDLMWSESSDNVGVTGYKVFRDGVEVGVAVTPDFSDTGLNQGISYVYTIKAFDAAENISSESDALSVMTLPAPPENIYTTESDDAIYLSWIEVSGAAGYDIEADGVVIDNGASMTYIHSGLTPDTQHVYRIRAKNSSGTGDWSNALTLSTSEFENILLGKPAVSSSDEMPELSADKAVDGFLMPSSRWSSNILPAWLSVDLGAPTWISRWVVRHMGSSDWPSPDYNLSDFKLQGSNDNITWDDIDIVVNNTESITDRTINPVEYRYIRLYVTKGLNINNQIASIMEFEVYEASCISSYLSDLATSSGTLAPVFSSLICDYTASVGYDTGITCLRNFS